LLDILARTHPATKEERKGYGGILSRASMGLQQYVLLISEAGLFESKIRIRFACVIITLLASGMRVTASSGMMWSRHSLNLLHRLDELLR
jgi:hypothetical protein